MRAQYVHKKDTFQFVHICINEYILSPDENIISWKRTHIK